MCVPDDARISSRHCELIWTANSCRLHDLRSTNGTFVNAARVSRPVLLQDGDVIVVGDTMFRVAVSTAEPSAADLLDPNLVTMPPCRPITPPTAATASPALPRNQPPVVPPAPPVYSTRSNPSVHLSRGPVSVSRNPTQADESAPVPAEDRPAAPGDLVLAVRDGPEAGKQTVVRPGETAVVGRSPSAQLSLPHDSQMSAKHFIVRGGDDGFEVADFGSRTGTRVNGAELQLPVLVTDGDIITAGDTSFLVIMETGEVVFEGMDPFPPPGQCWPAPAEPPGPESSDTSREREDTQGSEFPGPADVPGHVTVLLRTPPEPLFALLDAARTPRVLELLAGSGEEYVSMVEGVKGDHAGVFAPYLVSLPTDSALLESLVREGWGQSWGIYLTSGEPLAGLRKHLLRFLLMRTEEGEELYFRFYVPQVLRGFLPGSTPQELAQFFGPVTRFVAESEDVQVADCFWFDGLLRTTRVLVDGPAR